MSAVSQNSSPPGGAVPESLADAVLMIRPAAFGPNPETAASNRFQRRLHAEPETATRAREEFDRFASALEDAGVEVVVNDDTPEPSKPDAVFPNNWFTTHANGVAVLYPMLAPSRRAERRPELIAALQEAHGRVLSALVDLSRWERQGCALEGTGSLVLDRRRRTAYASLSPRTSPGPLAQWAQLMDYRVECFTATDRAGVPVYHTNVMMSVGADFAVVALDSIAAAEERRRVRSALEEAELEILEISREQVAGFAANLLQLAGRSGPVIAMSATALASLGPVLVSRLERHGRLVAVPVPTIEHCGGGSVRCMLAEVFLPKAA